eukprot:CAMPEP_0172482866 /NCGR_PEP_ID=MMETSP1066-20121228/9517_1 /TAXON_ID=671091 /ORGANISM="Coscinodiscus wailesii, Strain CCMP2513" /LENGTH=283 /DNA_ID=CAMNT_0013246333 /DNA_START=133 /DNA_END=984 /DNA_ORIENTATION=-
MSGNAEPNKVTNTGQLVPETILKRRHDLDELNAKHAANAIKNPRRSRKIFSKKPIKVTRPDKIIIRARSQKNHTKRFNRVLKKGMQKRASEKLLKKTKVIQAMSKDEKDREVTYSSNSVGAPLLFAIRVRGKNGTPRQVNRTLVHLHLKEPNMGIFLKNTKSTFTMLQLVDPYVIYGVPSKQTVMDLMKRRGHVVVEGERVPLSDNTVIEKALGEEFGIICVEDLVEEITSPSSTFNKVAKILSPFNLASIRTKFQKNTLDDQDGKEYGDIGEEMDTYIRKML